MTIEMPAMQVSAPAKINLSLKILRRREDGFHEIETIIAPVSLSDELTIDKNSTGQGIGFRCNDASVPVGDDNLIVRAAAAFFQATKIQGSVSIELKKKIPQGAGLGGGSSDAASTLLALNDLFDAKLSREALAKIASTIGSDVPFFIFGSPALCRGRGEVIEPGQMNTQFSLLLLKPDFGVPTAWAYGRWQNSRSVPKIRYEPQEFSGQTFFNDLERPVFEKYIFLAHLKMWLLEQPEVAVAMMSGSGATLFAIFKESVDGDRLAARAKEQLDPNLWTCACHTV